MGILIALRARSFSGKGQHVDISLQECVAAAADWIIPRYSYEGAVLERGKTGTVGAPIGIYPCSDGYVHLWVNQLWQWRSFLEWIGSPEVLADPIWEVRSFRYANADVIDPFVTQFTGERTKEELYEEAQRRHIPCTPLRTPAEYTADPQARARGYFLEMEHPKTGKGLYAGAPYRLSATPWRMSRSAPLLGEHNEEIYCGWLGLSKKELAVLRRWGAI